MLLPWDGFFEYAPWPPAATSTSPTRDRVKLLHLTAAGVVGVYAV
jgi:hypothetical protein